MGVSASVPCRMGLVVKCRWGPGAAERSPEDRVALQVSSGSHLVGMQKRFRNPLSIADRVPGTGLGTFGMAVRLPVGLTTVWKRKLVS